MEGDSGELFAATKGAVMAFTRSLALSLAPEVRVNALAPGWIKTAWGETASPAWQDRVLRETPLARWGTPEDVARVACFLVGPAAEFLTGQVVRDQRRGRPMSIVRIGNHRKCRVGVDRRLTQAIATPHPLRHRPAGRVRPAAGARRPGPRAGFVAEVAVLPISVAALMTPKWVARHLEVAAGHRPGHPARPLPGRPGAGASRRRGRPGRARSRRPARPAPPFRPGRRAGWKATAPSTSRSSPRSTTPRGSLARSSSPRPSGSSREGADVIDLGCDPGATWDGVGDAVEALRDRGLPRLDRQLRPGRGRAGRRGGGRAGPERQRDQPRAAADWGVEVVAIPDGPGSLDGLDETIEFLDPAGSAVPDRPDPRADRLRLRGLAGPLPRGPPALSRGGA